MKPKPVIHRLGCALGMLCLAGGNFAQAEARLEVIEFPSQVLRNNPLRDPVTRRVAIFVPDQFTNHAALPVVYYLPGYGSASDQFIKDATAWTRFTQKLAEQVTPVLFVVVDGRNRWGGSQYLNSPAQGNYADYVCDEIVSVVEARYFITTNPPQRIIAGHSSGGFGALRLGMLRPKLFAGVVALSPDSDFPLSHLPLVQVPAVSRVPLVAIKACMAAEMTRPLPTDGDLTYALGLSAAYAATGHRHPGEFEWLYDAKGQFRAKVWERWLDNDPLTMVRRGGGGGGGGGGVFVVGAAQDSFQANVGARKIYEVLHERPARCAFYEPPGGHGDHLPERLARGLAWVFHRPLLEIK